MSELKTDGTIDAVVTWVDGDDPSHAQKLATYLPAGAHRPAGAAPTRYRSVGEIEDCVASLLTHAPYLRRVHVITDNQRPPFLDAGSPWPRTLRERVQVVDHQVIFRGHEDLLPTFNSRSIETMMWRIPGIAERFVYLNDDFLLLRPVPPEEFFRDGLPVLRGQWRIQTDKEWARRLRSFMRRAIGRPKPPSLTHQRSQALAAAMVGFRRRYYSMNHLPHPLRRATLEHWFVEHPGSLRDNARHRLRSIEQFGVCALAHHLEIKQGSARLGAPERLLYLEPSGLDATQIQAALKAAHTDAHQLFGCVQSLDEARDEIQAQVIEWLGGVSGRTSLAASPRPPE